MLRRAVGLRGPALACATVALLLSPQSSQATGIADTLSFEFPDPAKGFAGWYGGPPGTVFPDSILVHGGRFAARFERGPTSPNEFSVLTRMLPVTFQGDTAEVRGWLRTDDVKGFAGLWLREDGPGGGSIQFDNMEDRGLSGTTPWTEHRVALPLDRKARKIVFGALLAGRGTLRADDLQLLVDGRPAADAPALVREPTAVELDHEFDAGSRIDVAKLSGTQVRNVALLAKVWGFVKYRHPRAADAKLHWDYELFRVLPELLAAKGRPEASAVLAKWIDRIGDPPACDPCATPPDSAYLLPRTAWILDRKNLGEDLSKRLERIDANRDADGEQYYVDFAGGYIPGFSSEAAYADRPFPDAGYRLLALFRFWNMIEYWFPYRDLIPEDWDRVLDEFIPRVLAAGDLDSYQLAMLALVARARDGHASVWNALDARPPRGKCQLPVVIRAIEGRFVVSALSDSTLAAASGLQVGDVILALDGETVEASARKSAEFIGASNEVARRREVARFLTRGKCGACRVAIERAGKRLTLAARRDSTSLMDAGAGATNDLPGPAFRLLDSDVAYLKMSSFKQIDVGSYLEQAAGTKCLVIDIRNYPSEFAPFALGGHLVESDTPFVRFTTGDIMNPGAFLWRESVRIPALKPRYEGKVVILVDERSQSQAEYTAMAFRAAPGAVVVGSTTAGADGNLTLIPLPGGLRAAMTGLGVFYPDKRPTQQIGITPDLIVTPTIAGIRSGRDEVLEAAIKKALGREMTVWRR